MQRLMNWKEINKKYKSKIQKGLGIEIGTGEQLNSKILGKIYTVTQASQGKERVSLVLRIGKKKYSQRVMI